MLLLPTIFDRNIVPLSPTPQRLSLQMVFFSLPIPFHKTRDRTGIFALEPRISILYILFLDIFFRRFPISISCGNGINSLSVYTATDSPNTPQTPYVFLLTTSLI